MKRTAFLCSLIVMMLSGCNTSLKIARLKQSKLQVEHLGINVDKNATDKIVFLTFDVIINDSIHDVHSFKLKNKIIADGVVKKAAFKEGFLIEQGYLYYEISATDASDLKNLLKVQNPLERTYEYVTEDGKLSKQTFYSNKGELTIRFQYDNSLKSISIFKPEKNSIILKKIYYATL